MFEKRIILVPRNNFNDYAGNYLDRRRGPPRREFIQQEILVNCCGGDSERDEESGRRRALSEQGRNEDGWNFAEICTVTLNLVGLGSMGSGLWLKFTGQGKPSPDSTTASYSSTTVASTTERSSDFVSSVGLDNIMIAVPAIFYAIELSVCCFSCWCKKREKSRPSTASTRASSVERQDI